MRYSGCRDVMIYMGGYLENCTRLLLPMYSEYIGSCREFCGREMAMAADHQRHWLCAHGHHDHQRETFLIMSYNVLADANARTHSKDLCEHVPALITDWEARKSALASELQMWSPDVICLQEVDRYHEFAEELLGIGYTGVYKKRTGAFRDGCAMFWRGTAFEALEEESVEFRDYKLRDNVAQICVLERKSELGLGFKNRVVVCNVHVMFNPLHGDVKLGQTRVLLEKAHSMCRRWGDVPVVIAGDFNSTPWSPLYQFLSSSYLDVAGLDRRCISGQDDDGEGEKRSRTRVAECERHGEPIREELVSDCVEKKGGRVSRKRISIPKKVQGWDPFELMAATGGRHLSVVQHKLKLRSVYSEIEGKRGSRDARGEPFVTSFHRTFKGTVDYIWHSEGLCAVRVLDTPPTSVLLQDKGMPSKRWASDHLALACELSFVPRQDKKI